jgi:hypothetical protein
MRAKKHCWLSEEQGEVSVSFYDMPQRMFLQQKIHCGLYQKGPGTFVQGAWQAVVERPGGYQACLF